MVLETKKSTREADLASDGALLLYPYVVEEAKKLPEAF